MGSKVKLSDKAGNLGKVTGSPGFKPHFIRVPIFFLKMRRDVPAALLLQGYEGHVQQAGNVGTIGDDKTIATADFLGINFILIQALEKQTADNKKIVDKNKAEKDTEIVALQSENEELKSRLTRLEKMMAKVAESNGYESPWLMGYSGNQKFLLAALEVR